MVIKKNRAPMVEFGELEPGEVFIERVDGEEFVEMKTHPIEEDDGSIWNTVSLCDGMMYYTKPTKQVVRVSAELNIL